MYEFTVQPLDCLFYEIQLISIHFAKYDWPIHISLLFSQCRINNLKPLECTFSTYQDAKKSTIAYRVFFKSYCKVGQSWNSFTAAASKDLDEKRSTHRTAMMRILTNAILRWISLSKTCRFIIYFEITDSAKTTSTNKEFASIRYK